MQLFLSGIPTTVLSIYEHVNFQYCPVGNEFRSVQSQFEIIIQFFFWKDSKQP